MTTPFLGVPIDTYNQERFIEEAIQVALSQDFPASRREILVVDDGSPDRSPEILAKFASQIRILRKTNGGQDGTRKDRNSSRRLLSLLTTGGRPIPRFS